MIGNVNEITGNGSEDGSAVSNEYGAYGELLAQYDDSFSKSTPNAAKKSPCAGLVNN